MRVSKSTLMQSTSGLGIRVAAVAVICAGLPACGGMGKALGLEKSSPDEFAIVTKAPLVIPPEFALRPPKPGAPRPNEQKSADVAAAALFDGSEAGHASSSTAGETLLLSNAGALGADSSIRQMLTAETQEVKMDVVEEKKDRSFFDRVFFWRGPDAEEEEHASAQDAEKAAAQKAAEENAERARRKGWF